MSPMNIGLKPPLNHAGKRRYIGSVVKTYFSWLTKFVQLCTHIVLLILD